MSDFIKYLEEVVWPTEQEKNTELWDVSGILKNHSNQFLKFDIKDMKKLHTGETGKIGDIRSKADKIVFETGESWVILDNDSLINYIIDNQIKVIHMETLLKELDWTMEIPKNG
tara:strand:+ start:3176 stop:3517 length:342 start_codon:yes stop_codon:yes gene_type:complete